MVTAQSSGGRRRRVLHCITHLGLGGAERVAVDLIAGMSDDFEGAVFAVHGRQQGPLASALSANLAEKGVKVFIGSRWELKRGGIVVAALQAARAMGSFRPDVVHLHTEIPEASYAAMVALRPTLRRIPIVRTIHNSQYWSHWRRVGAWCERRLPDAHVAGVSRAAIDAFISHRAKAGVPPIAKGPVLIFNGVDVPAQHPRESDPKRIRLLFAGRFESQKGAGLLPAIISATRLPAGCVGHLTLHGSGEFEPQLQRLAGDPPTGWSIDVKPAIPDLVQHLANFDLLLMPSRFEGLSMLAVEAMLSGLPLVATDAPGLREQLPRDHPWKARPADAADFARVLTMAIASRTEWLEVAARSQRFARENFNRGRMLRGYRELYRRALGGG
jgi:glycosyltransferase involved in cell wall biosynthesis